MKHALWTLLVKSAFKFSLNPQEIQEWSDFITMKNITKLEPNVLQSLPSLRQSLSLIKDKVTFQIHEIKYLPVTKKI